MRDGHCLMAAQAEFMGDRANLLMDEGAYFPPSRYPALISVYSGEIQIGAWTFFGYGVKLLASAHDLSLRGQARQHAVDPGGRDIVIGRGVWVASFATLIGPCSIGDDAVIGAGSVVTGDVPAGEFWAGNPARFVRRIDFKDQ